jgi:hypothetical protein
MPAGKEWRRELLGIDSISHPPILNHRGRLPPGAFIGDPKHSVCAELAHQVIVQNIDEAIPTVSANAVFINGN